MNVRRAASLLLVNLKTTVPRSNPGFLISEMSNKFSTDSREGRLAGKVAIVTASTQG
jgi:hypothetical protein